MAREVKFFPNNNSPKYDFKGESIFETMFKDIIRCEKIINELKNLQRYTLEWESMSKHEYGDYIKYKHIKKIVEKYGRKID